MNILRSGKHISFLSALVGSLAVLPSPLVSASQIITGDGYFLVHLNGATWKVGKNGVAQRARFPGNSVQRAAFGNGHWVGISLGSFLMSNSGTQWERISLDQKSQGADYIGSTIGPIIFGYS